MVEFSILLVVISERGNQTRGSRYQEDRKTNGLCERKEGQMVKLMPEEKKRWGWAKGRRGLKRGTAVSRTGKFPQRGGYSLIWLDRSYAEARLDFGNYHYYFLDTLVSSLYTSSICNGGDCSPLYSTFLSSSLHLIDHAE